MKIRVSENQKLKAELDKMRTDLEDVSRQLRAAKGEMELVRKILEPGTRSHDLYSGSVLGASQPVTPLPILAQRCREDLAHASATVDCLQHRVRDTDKMLTLAIVPNAVKVKMMRDRYEPESMTATEAERRQETWLRRNASI